MSESELVRILKDCWLTETESKVYLALLKGSGNAREVSVRSKVPYTKIHITLSSLLKKGLITASSERPTIYSAKGVSEGLGEYRMLLKRNVEEVVKRAEQMLMALQKEPEKSDIWIIRNNEEILKKSYQMLIASKKELKIALPTTQKWLAERLLPVFMRLRGEGVEISVLVTKSANSEDVQMLSRFSKIKIRDKMFGGGVIVDRNEVLLFIGKNEGEMDAAIWANHMGLVQLANAYFEFLWVGSEGP
ncbi:MAG: TrmB family transcriptional regulator [Candidatus Methanomethylicaceae archaeon]